MFFRLTLLALGLFFLGRIFSGYRWHIVLQWLGALALAFAVVLLIMKK
jgi:hypothetical protein